MPSLGALIARNVAAERVRRQWTQDHLAARMGWNGSTVSRLETGQRSITCDDLIPLCQALGVTLTRLCDGATPRDLAILGLPAVT